ncbi:MAG: SDR family NAD(P)-dependent oxidoreductase [Eubacteriales bacterium]|nr:SDR family NAD(P)-dependent oxidoreductase [Eubacteriales bacterium]
MYKNPYGSVALVTGASSGIGYETAHALAKLGFTVYGGSRRGGEDAAYGGGNITMLKMDVTDGASVKKAVDDILEKEGRIDILINCAGNGIAGAVEDCSGEEALKQMDVNYAGALRCIGAVLPSMREKRNGLIVNIGSVGGIFSIPFQTLYSSSKYAVEALTEGLRIELKPWGVKASLVEPGDVKTGFTSARAYAEGCKASAYGARCAQAIKQMERDEQNGKAPGVVVKEILKTIRSKNPPVRRTVGGMYKVLVFLKRLLPARLVEALLDTMYPGSKVK